MIDDESDVPSSLDGLPSGLSEAEFRARFGMWDSPAYQAEIAEIAGRIRHAALWRVGQLRPAGHGASAAKTAATASAPARASR